MNIDLHCHSNVSDGALAPTEVARRAAFRNLRHVTVRDAGHMLHHDQPGQVARLMEEFLLA